MFFEVFVYSKQFSMLWQSALAKSKNQQAPEFFDVLDILEIWWPLVFSFGKRLLSAFDWWKVFKPEFRYADPPKR